MGIKFREKLKFPPELHFVFLKSVTSWQRIVIIIRARSSSLPGYALDRRSVAVYQLHQCVRGYHVYRNEWDVAVGEQMESVRGKNN